MAMVCSLLHQHMDPAPMTETPWTCTSQRWHIPEIALHIYPSVSPAESSQLCAGHHSSQGGLQRCCSDNHWVPPARQD